MKQFGPVFKLAYWQTVWEVSGAAPAPHNADEEQMDRWINSIYWVISETEVLQVFKNDLIGFVVYLVISIHHLCLK